VSVAHKKVRSAKVATTQSGLGVTLVKSSPEKVERSPVQGLPRDRRDRGPRLEERGKRDAMSAVRCRDA
jgi:hypothetical protein